MTCPTLTGPGPIHILTAQPHGTANSSSIRFNFWQLVDSTWQCISSIKNQCTSPLYNSNTVLKLHKSVEASEVSLEVNSNINTLQPGWSSRSVEFAQLPVVAAAPIVYDSSKSSEYMPIWPTVTLLSISNDFTSPLMLQALQVRRHCASATVYGFHSGHTGCESLNHCECQGRSTLAEVVKWSWRFNSSYAAILRDERSHCTFPKDF